MSALEIIRAERDAHAFALREVRGYRDTCRRLEREDRAKAELEPPAMAKYRRETAEMFADSARAAQSIARTMRFSIDLVTRRHYRRVA